MFTKKKNQNPGQPAQQLTQATPARKQFVFVPDIIAPPSVEIDFNHIRVGEKYYKTLFMVGYPRFVSANWLEPLINFEHSMNVSMFIYPTSSADVLSDLRRKIAEMEATIASQQEQCLFGGRTKAS